MSANDEYGDVYERYMLRSDIYSYFHNLEINASSLGLGEILSSH